MRTRDVMSSPVVTVAPDAHLKDVAATLVERGINAVPVVEEGDRLVGIVTEADLLTLEAALTPGARPGSLAAGKGPPHTAGEVMSQSVYTLTEDADATAAARLMLRHRLKSVPVVAGDRVVGIVARRDLLRLVARGDDDIRADLQRRLQEEVHALQGLDLHVADGVVTIDGPVGPLARQLVDALARTVPGVLEVRSTTSAPMVGDRIIANVGPPRSDALGVGWVGRVVVGGDAHDDLVLSGLLDGVGGRVAREAQRPSSARESGQEDGEGVGDLRLVVDEHLGGPMQLASG